MRLRIIVLVLLVAVWIPVLAQGTGYIFMGAGAIATSTSTPPLPNGVSAPQFGSWSIQVNDNFNTDSVINTSLWNGGPGGPGGSFPVYYPFCWPSNNCPNTSYPDSGSFADCIGFAGLSPVSGTECNQVYEATDGNSGNTLVNGVGLETIAYMNYAGNNPSVVYNHNQWAGLQNYGLVNIVPNSFVEWKGQQPTNTTGASNGEHSDYWCTNSARQFLGTNPNGAEVDVAENVSGTSSTNHTTETLSVFDANTTLAQGQVYSAPGNPDFTAGMHTFGLWWKYPTSGATAGQFLLYVDGSEISGSPFNLNSVNWYNPPTSDLYCFAAYMDPSFSSASGGSGYAGNAGSTVNSSSTDPGSPLKTQYFRYWLGGPSPTPTPGPGPQFVSDTETTFGNCNGTTATAQFSPDASVANGNVLVALVQEDVNGFSSAVRPSGWTEIGTVTDSVGHKLDEWIHTYSSSDTVPYPVGGGPNFCAVKIVVGDYSSATGLDTFANHGTSASGNGCTIPALAATAHANELYIGWVNSDASGGPLWNLPSGWTQRSNESASWSSLYGDFAVATQGTVPAAQAATLVSGSGNNDCMGTTIY